jgi:hypothetical protein
MSSFVLLVEEKRRIDGSSGWLQRGTGSATGLDLGKLKI